MYSVQIICQMLKPNRKKIIDMIRSNEGLLLVNYDRVHTYMLLHDIDEVMDEDDQRDISLDHDQKLNILDNDH